VKSTVLLLSVLSVAAAIAQAETAKTVPVSDRKIRFLLGVGTASSTMVVTETETDGRMLRVTVGKTVYGITPFITNVQTGAVAFGVFEILAVDGGEGMRQLDTARTTTNAAAVTTRGSTKFQIAAIEIMDAPHAASRPQMFLTNMLREDMSRIKGANDHAGCITCTYDGAPLTACACTLEVACGVSRTNSCKD
jgi:hypothetical protein